MIGHRRAERSWSRIQFKDLAPSPTQIPGDTNIDLVSAYGSSISLRFFSSIHQTRVHSQHRRQCRRDWGRDEELRHRRRGEMNVSHATVHPVEDPPTTDGADDAPRLRMKDMEGMPGTRGGLALRLAQFAFAAAAVVVMATTSDFPSVTAFWYVSIYSTRLVAFGSRIGWVGWIFSGP